MPDDIADRAVGPAVRSSATVRWTSARSTRCVARPLERSISGPSDAAIARELLLLRAQAQAERRVARRRRSPTPRTRSKRPLAAGDRRQEGIARRLLGILHQRDGDLAGARQELGASVDIFREFGDDAELASSLRERGLAEVFGGSLGDAEWLLGEAEALTERLHDLRGRAWVRQHQAWVAFLSGDAALAEARLLTAAQEFDLLGDRFGRGWAAGLLAYVRFYQRRFEEAEALAIEVRRDAMELGDPWAPAMMDSLIAAIRLWSSRFVEAEELSRRALTSFRQLGDKFGVVQALSPRMRALVALGRTHEAERGIEESLAMSDSFGDLSFPMMAAAGAAVHLGLGERAAVDQRAGARSFGGDGSRRLRVADHPRVGAVPGRSCRRGAWRCSTGRERNALPVVRCGRWRRAITADPSGAIDDADRVGADAGASYLDRVVADVAAAAATMQLRRARDAAVDRFERAHVDRQRGRRRRRPRAGRAWPVGRPGRARRTTRSDHLGAGWRARRRVARRAGRSIGRASRWREPLSADVGADIALDRV